MTFVIYYHYSPFVFVGLDDVVMQAEDYFTFSYDYESDK